MYMICYDVAKNRHSVVSHDCRVFEVGCLNVVKTSRLLLHLAFLEKHIVRFKSLQASYGIKVYLVSVFDVA
jgi:hypothetical protein